MSIHTRLQKGRREETKRSKIEEEQNKNTTIEDDRDHFAGLFQLLSLNSSKFCSTSI